MPFKGIKALSLQHKLNALHHKPMLIGTQKGVKNETIAMLYSQNTVFLDFQN